MDMIGPNGWIIKINEREGIISKKLSGGQFNNRRLLATRNKCIEANNKLGDILCRLKAMNTFRKTALINSVAFGAQCVQKPSSWTTTQLCITQQVPSIRSQHQAYISASLQDIGPTKVLVHSLHSPLGSLYRQAQVWTDMLG